MWLGRRVSVNGMLQKRPVVVPLALNCNQVPGSSL